MPAIVDATADDRIFLPDKARHADDMRKCPDAGDVPPPWFRMYGW
jgi:hypothetical protein